ncbi:MAG: hypothetical protein Q9176_000419 [Flavoplaca citrina]
MDGDMHRSVRERQEVEEALRQGQTPTSFEAWLASLSPGGKGKARSRKAGAGKSQNRRSVVTVLQNLSHRVGTIRLATLLQPLAQIVPVNNKLNDLYVSLSATPGPTVARTSTLYRPAQTASFFPFLAYGELWPFMATDCVEMVASAVLQRSSA